MTERTVLVDTINDCLLEMAKEIAVARFPYTGAATRILPGGDHVTREEYWNGLSTEEQYGLRQESYAAWMVLSRFGIESMMIGAFEEYMSEK